MPDIGIRRTVTQRPQICCGYRQQVAPPLFPLFRLPEKSSLFRDDRENDGRNHGRNDFLQCIRQVCRVSLDDFVGNRHKNEQREEQDETFHGDHSGQHRSSCLRSSFQRKRLPDDRRTPGMDAEGEEQGDGERRSRGGARQHPETDRLDQGNAARPAPALRFERFLAKQLLSHNKPPVCRTERHWPSTPRIATRRDGSDVSDSDKQA